MSNAKLNLSKYELELLNEKIGNIIEYTKKIDEDCYKTTEDLNLIFTEKEIHKLNLIREKIIHKLIQKTMENQQ